MSDQDMEMSLVEHLRELRTRIIRSLLAVVVSVVVSCVFWDKIFAALVSPMVRAGISFQYLNPFSGLNVSFKVSLYFGLLVALPFVLYQLYMFVLPALRPVEKRVVVLFLLYGSIAAYLAIIFTYAVVLPVVLPKVSSMFSLPQIESHYDVERYLQIIIRFFIMFMVAFQLPLGVLILGKLGLVNVASLRKYRGYVIIAVFIVAAVLTPPDVVSQITLALPMVVLYEVGIILVKFFAKKTDALEAHP